MSTVSVYQQLISPLVTVSLYHLIAQLLFIHYSLLVIVSACQLLLSFVISVSVYELLMCYHLLCLSASHLT